MRFHSHALQTLASYVGWQLQRPPAREAQDLLCLTSMPVRCPTGRSYSGRRTFRATGARQSHDASRSLTAADAVRRKKERK